MEATKDKIQEAVEQCKEILSKFTREEKEEIWNIVAVLENE